jgi:transcriptional regulator with XRE-family HTH domain
MTTQYAELLRIIRIEKGYSQLELAEKLDLSRASYIAIEQGRRELTLSESEKLSQFLGVSVSDIKRGEIPNYEKYKQMILLYLRMNESITKTKLAKLLYFADFAWYYKNLSSMSGMEYRKIQYGPVADSYFRLIDEMCDNGEINIELKEEGAMHISKTTAGAKHTIDQIGKDEIILIKKINTKWKDRRTTEIVSFTHKQLPFLLADDNEIVSYNVFGQENPDDIY